MSHKLSLSTRLSSMFIDHTVSSLVFVPLWIAFDQLLHNTDLWQQPTLKNPFFYFIIIVYLNKDFFSGRSIAKRIFGLRVVNNVTGKPASSIRCFVRNLTAPIWPLEVVIAITSPNRRIGDFIANTRIDMV